jgi:hypothetical protein
MILLGRLLRIQDVISPMHLTQDVISPMHLTSRWVFWLLFMWLKIFAF